MNDIKNVEGKLVRYKDYGILLICKYFSLPIDKNSFRPDISPFISAKYRNVLLIFKSEASNENDLQNLIGIKIEKATFIKVR